MKKDVFIFNESMTFGLNGKDFTKRKSPGIHRFLICFGSFNVIASISIFTV